MELQLFCFYFPWIEIHGYHMIQTYGSLIAQLQQQPLFKSRQIKYPIDFHLGTKTETSMIIPAELSKNNPEAAPRPI